MPSLEEVEVAEEVFENVLIGLHLKCMRYFGYIVSTRQLYKRIHLWRGMILSACMITFCCLSFIKISRGFANLADGANSCALGFTFLSTSIAIINGYLKRKRVVRMIIFLHEDITQLFRITDREEEQMLNETIKYIQLAFGITLKPIFCAALLVLVDTLGRTLLKPETVFNMPEVLNGTAKPILIFQLFPYGEVYDNFFFYYFGAIFALFLAVFTLPAWPTFTTCLFKYIILKYAIINKRLRNYDLAKLSFNKHHRELNLLPEKELQYWHTKMCGFCIRELAKLRWFTKELQSLIKIPVFTDFILYSVLICFLCFAIAEGNLYKMDICVVVLYIFIMVCLLWLYHWHATLVAKSNDDLHAALYCCPWYTFPVNIQKNILLMMMECTKPLTMKAVFVDINVTTFVAIIRSAYGYFSILRNANAEE